LYPSLLFYPCCAKTAQRQSGAALVEAMLALLPILLIGSLCIELARGYQTRHLLILSMQETARVAAVQHADPQRWQPALKHSLARLFVPAGRFASPQARLEATRQAFQARFQLPLWRMQRISSTPDTIHLRLIYFYQPLQEWLRMLLQTFHIGEQGLIPIVVDYRVLRHYRPD
jgi:hypothetical protein